MDEKGVLSFTDYAGYADGAAPAMDAGAFSSHSSHSSELIRTAQTYLEQHAAENVTVDDTAAACHVSPAHLMRQFKKETGCSVHAWLTRYRIQKACGLIQQGLPITAVCEQLGYTDYPLFYRNFCKITGSSPRAYQKGCGEHAAGGEHRVLQYSDWHWSGYRGTEQA